MKGLYAEKLFEVECLKRNIKISKPLSPTSRYDFLVEVLGKIYKIQVKSTIKKRSDRPNYRIKLSNGKSYTEEDVNYFAVYIEPLDIWYILPYGTVKEVKCITVSTNKRTTIYDPFQDAWALLSDPKK